MYGIIFVRRIHIGRFNVINTHDDRVVEPITTEVCTSVVIGVSITYKKQ